MGLKRKLAIVRLITELDPDVITRQFVDTQPNSGVRSVAGFLRGMGLRIQRSRVRDSLMRIDPRGIEAQFRRALHWRQYSVCMSNSLWLIDR